MWCIEVASPVTIFLLCHHKRKKVYISLFGKCFFEFIEYGLSCRHSMPITINIEIADSVLTANDNKVIKELGHALGIDDPVNMPLQDLEDALVAWIKRKVEAERNRGGEQLLASERTSIPLFP